MNSYKSIILKQSKYLEYNEYSTRLSETLMSAPPVLMGLIVYLMFSSKYLKEV
jgi:ABC-type tungstate transport system substrate-binding protein